MSIKIIRITTEINRGSIGRTAEQLGNLVINEGWDSYIVYGRNDGKSNSIKLRIGNKFVVYWHVLLTRLLDLHGYGSYFATKKLIKTIDQIKPNIIHLHDIHGYYINLKVLFKYFSRREIPIVWTQHDCWAFTGHCAFFTSVNCNKWKKGCFKCPLIKSYPKSLFIDRSYKNYNVKKQLFTSINNLYIVAVSDWMEKLLKESFFRNSTILKIYNGIDTSVFKPNSLDLQSLRFKYNFKDKKILLAVATSWGDRKGLSDYFKLREIIDDSFLIVLVGLPAKISASLPSGIIGVSRTDNVEELVNIYSSASIVLNLAYEESFGKTTPEGMACGIPSIVYDCTASPELVDENTGIIVEKGNIKAVADAIYTIMKWNTNITQAYCRNRVVKYFDMDKNYNMYLNLYKSILGINKNNTDIDL